MEWISSMQQAIAYMEEHLLEEINYEDDIGLEEDIEVDDLYSDDEKPEDDAPNQERGM